MKKIMKIVHVLKDPSFRIKIVYINGRCEGVITYSCKVKIVFVIIFLYQAIIFCLFFYFKIQYLKTLFLNFLLKKKRKKYV